jgi:hypothetical protein
MQNNNPLPQNNSAVASYPVGGNPVQGSPVQASPVQASPVQASPVPNNPAWANPAPNNMVPNGPVPGPGSSGSTGSAATTNMAGNQAPNIVPVGMDLSGFKKDNAGNGPGNNATEISISTESGPILIEQKAADVQKEGNKELLKEPEAEINPEQAEKKETVSQVSPQPQPSNVKASLKDAKQKIAPLQKEVPVLKFDGFKIGDEILSNPEEIQQKKGKGDTGLAITAIYLFLDRLLRKQSLRK